MVKRVVLIKRDGGNTHGNLSERFRR
jgi:hypothetical protein